MNEALNRLVDNEHRLVRLFDPPFDRTTLEPGYIKGYLPGIRENGGQYTHGVCWLIQALVRIGRGSEAWKMFDLIHPFKITATAAGVQRYQGEPYVIAADVYAHPQHRGRSGWTWYTGSAAWLYRVAIEELLGFELRGNLLTLKSILPAGWNGFQLHYQHHATKYHITVTCSAGGKNDVILDGIKLPDRHIPLVDDEKEHEVQVLLPHACDE